jgi:hypothetical protein
VPTGGESRNGANEREESRQLGNEKH